MKKTVAFIGAEGSTESVIAHSLAKAGYRILLMDKNLEKSVQLQTSILYFSPGADVEVVSCAYESSWEADIVIPEGAGKDLQNVVVKIKAVVTGKIIIHMNSSTAGNDAAEELQKLLPYSKIVRIASLDFSNPPSAVIISGDDDPAVEFVFQLMQDAGFNPIVAGKLSANFNS